LVALARVVDWVLKSSFKVESKTVKIYLMAIQWDGKGLQWRYTRLNPANQKKPRKVL
jgi:hypothetical protein